SRADESGEHASPTVIRDVRSFGRRVGKARTRRGGGRGAPRNEGASRWHDATCATRAGRVRRGWPSGTGPLRRGTGGRAFLSLPDDSSGPGARRGPVRGAAREDGARGQVGLLSLLRSVRTETPRRSAALVRLFPVASRARAIRISSTSARLSVPSPSTPDPPFDPAPEGPAPCAPPGVRPKRAGSKAEGSRTSPELRITARSTACASS